MLHVNTSKFDNVWVSYSTLWNGAFAASGIARVQELGGGGTLTFFTSENQKAQKQKRLSMRFLHIHICHAYHPEKFLNSFGQISRLIPGRREGGGRVVAPHGQWLQQHSLMQQSQCNGKAAIAACSWKAKCWSQNGTKYLRVRPVGGWRIRPVGGKN